MRFQTFKTDAGARVRLGIVINAAIPVLPVDIIEPCLPFWASLGFEKFMEVAEDGRERLVFAGLRRGVVEVMLQTRDNLAVDMPGTTGAVGGTLLYWRVDALEAFEDAIQRAQLLFSERRTFYGAREVGLRVPGGHFVVLAEFGEDR